MPLVLLPRGSNEVLEVPLGTETSATSLVHPILRSVFNVRQGRAGPPTVWILINLPSSSSFWLNTSMKCLASGGATRASLPKRNSSRLPGTIRHCPGELRETGPAAVLSLVTDDADALSAKSKKEHFDEQSWDSLKSSPLYEVLREYKDVFPDDIPAELPQDKGVQHEIDLVPGTKYCVTRQWPLPRDQVKAIDDFFENRRKVGQVRESKSPHSAPTSCAKKAQGGWRIVHAYNKLNDATVPAQTPTPRKDVIIDSMALSTIFSALDLRDGFYQILMRESDIPVTAVSTPGSMLGKWLVMPQGLKNTPATFNRCVTHLLRSVRDFAPSYFDDVFIHSRAVNGKSDVEMHKVHLRKLFALMSKHKLCKPEEVYLRD
ncbi:unnamed protein product [Phytophthora fragariaefolia]|uniref:Unnamed protein product n=1 Tax=Phytophthora fragariaefolia TaxID=1490495 RepID=A0A9W6YG01_9STRA|nr:unnamed protein product [Phytophthora fragariaefolia]